jgi:AraC-like DNA-binding protein
MTEAPDIWRQTVADTFAQLVPVPLASAPPVGRVRSTPLGLARAFRVAGSPQILRRTTTSLRTAPADPLKICIQRAGRTVLHQGDVTLSLEPGELAVYDTGRPYALRLEGAWSCTVMTVPRDALSVPPRALAGAMRRSFGALSGAGAVLTHLLETATAVHPLPGATSKRPGGDTGPPAAPRLSDADVLAAPHLGEAGANLLAGLISAEAGLGGPAADLGDEALRVSVLAHIATHLARPDLDPGSVARAHHISTRTLYRLFEGADHSVAETIRGLRLDQIRDELADPALARHSTTEIAARWGFPVQAHFIRAFRARFGMTPAVYRKMVSLR